MEIRVKIVVTCFVWFFVLEFNRNFLSCSRFGYSAAEQRLWKKKHNVMDELNENPIEPLINWNFIQSIALDRINHLSPFTRVGQFPWTCQPSSSSIITIYCLLHCKWPILATLCHWSLQNPRTLLNFRLFSGGSCEPNSNTSGFIFTGETKTTEDRLEWVQWWIVFWSFPQDFSFFPKISEIACRKL